MEGYGVGPREFRILRTYWSRMRMVARSGGYYGAAFMSVLGVTQGDPLLPTIFNVVVNALVRHWVLVMVEGAEEQGGRRKYGRHQNPLFYADDGMVTSSDPRWLKRAFSTLVGLFDRVGLWTNARKTDGMVCHPFQAVDTQLQVAYGRRMTGEVRSYRERQRGGIHCK